VFAAQVYIKGIPTIVAVDDYLPVSSSGSLVFDIQAADGSLWGPLMEKVWAKANGNYEVIIGGDPSESLAFLLGAPTMDYSMTDASIGYTGASSSVATASANAW
jgi:hypothetical protein